MFEKLQQMEQNYSILQEKLNQPETYDDPKTATRLNRELKELEEVVSTYRTWTPELRRAGRAAAQR